MNPAFRVLSARALALALLLSVGASSSLAFQSMDDVRAAATARGLTTADLLAAAKTFTPSGMLDEYVMFSSGGHSGQVFAIGMPSMRLLKTIAVFTPEPWQGWGYGVGEEVMAGGDYGGEPVRWGDTHHPALSETAGDYDGQWLFINDKINARVGVIDLRDFEAKQIVKNPLTVSDHGGTFVTPNTEYVIEGGQYATPWGSAYAPLSEYKESYHGSVTLWKFDRRAGRIDRSKSFAMELPPYWQDLSDAGKGASDGWFFLNSINTEMATGGIESGNPPFEAGVSRNATDYLHIIDWKGAERVFQAGKADMIEGFPVISIKTAVAEGLIYLTPEPRSPHGVDVAPKGDFVVVSGKLDPHVTVYSTAKLKKAVAAKTFSGRDDWGIPILDFDAVVEAQVEVGLGPLHTQFGPEGYAYTSLFLDSAVARWTMGGSYGAGTPEPDWTLVHKTPVQYNVGHIGVAEGDTVSPDGKYLVAFNKWSVDRFLPPGPLLPQNFQLIDIANQGTSMPVIYDMPIGMGEPHYAQICKADKLNPWKVYPEVGWDPLHQRADLMAPKPGMERVTRNDEEGSVEVFMTAVRSHFKPEHVAVKVGDTITWRITNIERAVDATHGFAIPQYNINLSLEPGETATVEFTAHTAGTFPFYCSEFCSALHLEMVGYLLVEPTE
ncbi:Sec-dependent nitrous-oxide reductase [Engelhardtia mirabilis]|uniref:Nitrous-oxide reductase n=1 Tax=Engelhardtia mirabilis TaxID=2528011 RepID=A0A518BNV2_9BACT|nr:Nitrous-oxide reductase precursor [Planctomycetes bacterium Pla133]QDV02940.1 Nitrous-oxide reductase precursor [Planctomycetes bacterium Pla86]